MVPERRRHKKKGLYHLLGAVFCLSVYPTGPSSLPAKQRPFCEQTASYTINVVLDTENRMITAEERVSWTNSTERPVHELWFHLYWNGSQNNMTDFLVEGTQRWGRIIRQNFIDTSSITSYASIMRSVLGRLVSILCPSLGKKYEKIVKQTKQYEKIKFRVFNSLARNCLLLNNLEKRGGTNPCFPATPLIYL